MSTRKKVTLSLAAVLLLATLSPLTYADNGSAASTTIGQGQNIPVPHPSWWFVIFIGFYG